MAAQGGGAGTIEEQVGRNSRGYPPACKGRWGYVTSEGGAKSHDNGARPVE